MSSGSATNVVVVGGGCAGIIIAAKLEASLPSNYRVILVEKRPFFYHTIGGIYLFVKNKVYIHLYFSIALRAVVEDVDIMLSYAKLFKKNGKL